VKQQPTAPCGANVTVGAAGVVTLSLSVEVVWEVAASVVAATVVVDVTEAAVVLVGTAVVEVAMRGAADVVLTADDVVLTAAAVVLVGAAVVELAMRGAAVVAFNAEAVVALVTFIVDDAFVVGLVSATFPELAVAFTPVTSPEPLPVCKGIVESPDDPFTTVLLMAPWGTPESEEFASSAGT